ncbi:probable MET14-ATP adenosine-5`-phosphosulfate 3`-phosphotransferase [Serendipita indica DSM 11827]|uniref:Adenylyl-sulfate kinase n=1 Tax=Serendipita indica (strain DSM 11827) TaxID=1109443 RepID=G4TN66_SERID|nr:probable MET14-ATP adenosine-5`-phosphosulfate 3`-phosphotransferase [Serendipita indica DSM 11827]
MATNITFHAGSVSSEERSQLLGQKGLTIWLTGLSASGKSTIACALEQHLLHLKKFTYRLDGQKREHQEDWRGKQFRHYGVIATAEFSARQVAKLFSDAAAITITAFISPYKADRAVARDLHAAGNIPFVEVFIDAPLETVEKRDPKGLYKKAREGIIKEFTGISAPYEAPETPEIHIRTDQQDVAESVEIIVKYLQDNKYI